MGSRCFNKRLVSPLPSLSPSPSLPRLLSSRGQTGQLRRHRLFASEKQSFFSPPVRPSARPSAHLSVHLSGGRVRRPRPNFTSPDLCRRFPPPAIFAVGRRKAEGGGESGEGAATPRPTQPQRVRSLKQIMTGNFSRPDKTSFAGNLEQAGVFR